MAVQGGKIARRDRRRGPILARREPARFCPAVGSPLGVAARRDAVVVCIPVFEARSLFEQCLRSVADHTGAGTVLIADDASTDPASSRSRAASPRRPPHLTSPTRASRSTRGFVRNMNDAFAAAAPADVVILNSDVVVPAGWLERLRAAAYSDALVATASTLTNHGTLLSVPERNTPVLEPAARALAGRRGRRRRRRLAAPAPADPDAGSGTASTCAARRSTSRATSTSASRRATARRSTSRSAALQRGLVHVVADDLFVYHRGGASFGVNARQERARADPDGRATRTTTPPCARPRTRERTPLARSLAAARAALGGMSVTIDGSRARAGRDRHAAARARARRARSRAAAT